MTPLLVPLSVMVLLMSGLASAEGTERPRIDQQQANQERRIDQVLPAGN